MTKQVKVICEDSLENVGYLKISEDGLPLRGDNIICDNIRYVVHRREFNADNNEVNILVRKFIPNHGGF